LIFLGPATPCASPPPRPSTISDYYLLVHHHVNRDDRHLLGHAIASDFTVARQYSQIENFFVLGIKLRTLIWLGVSLPSLPDFILQYSRVARWFVFKPKIQIWVNFRGSCTGRCWVYFMETWAILRSFAIFYGHLV
jgi:hypothetical protein